MATPRKISPSGVLGVGLRYHYWGEIAGRKNTGAHFFWIGAQNSKVALFLLFLFGPTTIFGSLYTRV